ncbi:MAG: helix-turn-helix domain-containing protein [Candidatus Eremiobacteraeota bacterium]|nr:helix-turn-helix domain-containing protein [Candidatus Eremiobacteraeota bacterium]
MFTTIESLPQLRFEIPDAAKILRISRATSDELLNSGLITVQKSGRRTLITESELRRYVTTSL